MGRGKKERRKAGTRATPAEVPTPLSDRVTEPAPGRRRIRAVVLASATPSIETEVNARRGRYRRLALPERFGGQHMPGVEAIEIGRASCRERVFSSV